MTEGVKQIPTEGLADDQMFISGPFLSYIDGEDALLKKVKMSEVPKGIQKLWKNQTSVGNVQLMEEHRKALLDAKKGGGYCRFAYKGCGGFTPTGAYKLLIAPFLQYGPYKIIIDVFGAKLYRRIIEEFVPVELNQNWSNEGVPKTDWEKVQEWWSAVEMATTQKPSYCRWCPLPHYTNVDSWTEL